MLTSTLRTLPLALLLGASALLTGCGDATGVGDEANVTEGASCTATFRWLQKDAYKDTAGRTSALWPPHTTTSLDISCAGKENADAFQENHGTKPGAVDAKGDVFLVEVKSATVQGSQKELEALVDAYSSCECEAATKFLSMNSLNDEKVKALLGQVVAYLEKHLSCAGGTSALVDYLKGGQIDEAIGILETCSWDSGTDLATGLNEALTALLAASKEQLDGYHVCNNDATLQADLFATFQSTKKARACEATSALCKSPAWFYNP